LGKTIAVLSIGCKTNQQEMTMLGYRLMEKGDRIVERIEDAQVVVINTCSVTSETEIKTRRILRQLSRRTPHIDICVTGCLAQQKADEIKQEPNVRWVVGNACKNKIPDIIQNPDGGVFRECLIADRGINQFFSKSAIFYSMRNRTRFSVKIQEGCNFQCAYCIVPFLRGPSHSDSIENITSVCKDAIDVGFKEIVLAGTHIGQYRSESDEGLLSLIEKISMIPGDFRIRLSSLDPRDISKALIHLIGTNKKLCRHLHLSVQSLSPEVLSAMNRPLSDFGALIEMLVDFRTLFPEAGIGGDFIVGFPGETRVNFEETCSIVEKIGFSYGHVFRFSKRPMTRAAFLPGQIDENEKRERSMNLREILHCSHDKFAQELLGTHHRIIVEKEYPVSGRASNYLPIYVPGGLARRNCWCMVEINGIEPETGHCLAIEVIGERPFTSAVSNSLGKVKNEPCIL
jgi:threonylcarbamoyladenosine tRNA methylthiotransferase MtaB